MSIESVNNGRAKVKIDGRDFKIIIPSKKRYFTMVFLSAWIVGWALGEIFGLSMASLTIFALIKGDSPHLIFSGIALFHLAWLVGWTVGGVMAILTLLWNFVGREVITSDNETITVAKKILMLQRSKTYAKHDIKNIRYIGNEYSNTWTTGRRRIFEYTIAFDYGLQTIKFGDRLDEAEARYLIDEVITRVEMNWISRDNCK